MGNRELICERIEHSLPYRAMLVKGIENLLVADRCMSSYHEADRLTRHIPVCIGGGQAAGTAAALAARLGCTPRNLDIRLLQDTLESQGAGRGPAGTCPVRHRRPVAGLESHRTGCFLPMNTGTRAVPSNSGMVTTIA